MMKTYYIECYGRNGLDKIMKIVGKYEVLNLHTIPGFLGKITVAFDCKKTIWGGNQRRIDY